MSDSRAGTPAMRLIGAPFTPFDRDGGLNLSAVPAQADHLRATGVAGAFVAGTTGESASLGVAERKALAEAWCAAGEGLEIIVHVGSANLREARELAAHAAATGADAIGAVPPYYFRPSSVDALVDSMADIAAAAPDLPFFYYHIPVLTRVEMPMVPVLEAARCRIPNFAGIKFTHSDLIEYSTLVELAGDELEIMFGRDPLLMFAMAAGARSAVGSTYMFAASLYHELGEAFRAGRLDDARRATSKARKLVELANRHGGLVAQKAIYGMVAVDAGAARRPFQPLEKPAIEELRGFVDSGGLQADTGVQRA